MNIRHYCYLLYGELSKVTNAFASNAIPWYLWDTSCYEIAFIETRAPVSYTAGQNCSSLSVSETNIPCLAYHWLSATHLYMYASTLKGRLSDYITYNIWYVIQCLSIHTAICQACTSIYHSTVKCQCTAYFFSAYRRYHSILIWWCKIQGFIPAENINATVLEWWWGPI